MLDIKYIKENPEEVIARLAKKGKESRAEIERILELDAQRRALIAKTETIKAHGHQYENGVCQHCGAQTSTKPNKPGFGNIWDWIGGWWK